MKRELLKLTLQFFLTTIGILSIGSLPYLFFDLERHLVVLRMIESGELDNTLFLYDSMEINFQAYFHEILSTINSLFHITDFQYHAKKAEFFLFPEFLHKYLFSMGQLGVALFIGLILAILGTYLIMLVPTKRRNITKFVLFIFESLPDIFVVVMIQLIVIWIYKKTDILLFNIVNSFGDKAYVMPVLILSFLPTVYIIKYLLIAFEDENDRLYVELARGKGLRKSYILLVHILRNATITLFNNFKTIFWFSLSNLLMLEVVFNINGFTKFILDNCILNPKIMTIGLFMVFLPFFIIFSLTNLFIRKLTDQEVVR